MPISVQAHVVFPADQPPIPQGVVTVDGTRIVSVGKKAVGGELVNLGAVAILPGLINAHTHLEFSYLQQPLGQPGMSLVEWIRLVIAERGRVDYTPDPLRGLLESRVSGVAMIGDISTTAQRLHLDVLHFHEVIGFSRARAESAKQALVDRVGLNRGGIHGDKHGISPHAPYTVSPKLLKDLVSLAGEHNLPMAMHLAESREEIELLRDGTGPFQLLLEERSMWDADAIPRASRPLDYLRMLAESPRTLVIHGNYLDEEELSYLAAERERMSLVYCPRTHAYFFHSPYPLEKALALGARVALGTDSRASNPDLSLFEEMRHTVRSHPAVDPQQVLRMGTLAGAEALGCHRQIGSITPGKKIELIAIPIPDLSLDDPSEILASIFAAESVPSRVNLTRRPLRP